MIRTQRTRDFDKWLRGLKDRVAVAKVAERVRRLQSGLPGDVRPVGGGVSELRISHGPGYRVYFMWRGADLIILLAGGTKRRQAADIERARTLAKILSNPE